MSELRASIGEAAGGAFGYSSESAAKMLHIAQAIAGLKANGHGKILVVGCRGDNFPEPYRSHPQVVYWETGEGGDVPAATRIILLTRFLRHSLSDSLRAQARKKDILFSAYSMGTGEIRKLLDPLVQPAAEATEDLDVEPQAKEPVSPAERGLKRFAPGEAQAFVQRHGDIDAKPYSAESHRLAALAKSMGYHTTEASMAQTAYMLREDRSRRASELERVRARLHPAPEAPAAPVPEPPGAPTPVQAVVVAAEVPKTAALPPDDVEILRMLDDVTASVALIRDTVLRRAEKRQQLKQLLGEL